MQKNVNTPAQVDISLIITAHSEGLLAHKTMLSINQAILELDESIKYEVIISIDNGDQSTKEYFERYAAAKNHTVLSVSFKDLSLSRNNAVKHSKGTFVAFLDADDLVSSNWIADAYALAKSQPASIYHPEYSITFGDYNLIWKKRNSSDITTDTLASVENNLWDSPCMASRETFVKFPYLPIGGGVGFEDKHFNCETLAAGYSHVVVPDTVLYVRRKTDGSLLAQSSGAKATVGKTSLLSYESIQELDISTHDATNASSDYGHSKLKNAVLTASKQTLKKAHTYAVQYPTYANAVKGLREQRQARILQEVYAKYPDKVLRSWRDTHKIENQIFPSKELLKHIPWYSAESTVAGYVYAKTLKGIKKKPDTLFFVPHLIKGGADKVFINYLGYIGEINPSWSIAMLQTESTESVWSNKVPDGVSFVNYHHISSALDRDSSFRVLATLVNQTGIKRIIVGNSQLAYDFIAAYKTLLEALDVKIYCFAFGEEFDDEGRLWGLVHTGIPKIYPQIYKIITDNNNIVSKLEREYGFDPSKFYVHYQPTDLSIKEINPVDRKPLKVMWASRICKQKRPDILKAVSNKLDPRKYTVHAYGQLEEGLTPEYFSDSKVVYKGSFNGSQNLPIEDYDVFLYTSEGDGVPNMLQEITALGLPIVASNVGGIKEFIKDKVTGRLIIDHENIDDYVSAIESLTDLELRSLYNQNAQNQLLTTFSRDTLLQSVSRDFDK